jgi:hypothetical protein
MELHMRITLATIALSLTAAAFAAPLAAQHDHGAAGARGEAKLPPGWHLRLDRENQNPADVSFAVMAPGWHVTTGPSTILWNPEMTASGPYVAETEIHLFDPGERREAYGLFVGGHDLDGDDQRYTYFLIRRTGEFIVKRRAGAEAPTLIAWTRHEAIRPWSADQTTVPNTLAIDVGAENVRFLVNGQQVAELPRGDLSLDGIVGLRVNHALNVHVSRLDVRVSPR